MQPLVPRREQGLETRRRLRKRGVLLASSGLALALAVGLSLHLLGLSRITLSEWLLTVALTAGVQAVLFLIPHFGIDERLRWDPHYVYLPMLGSALLLAVYAYLVFEGRVLVLMAWQIGLLFLAGRVGGWGVAGLTAVMTAGYLAGIYFQQRRGLPVSLAFEVTVLAAFVAMTLYEAIIFERLRREREETIRLRRALTEMALTDPLTGLPNRREFENILRAELARIRRHGGRCSLVMVDVDHFKNFNDRSGHPAGDQVLREMARVIRGFFRTGDVAARYGGEEFALILFDAGTEEARAKIELLRHVVEQYPFSGASVQPGGRVTISAGLASCPTDATEFDELLSKADRALYEAKESGRNRVCAA